MSLDLSHDYEKGLRMAKPTVLHGSHVRPPPGALGAASSIPPQTIPPINTNIQFDILPEFKISAHPGLAAMDHTKLPKNFNWRQDGGDKSALLSKPGNQMLCGSCWAISAAGLVADNHVVSGTVDWVPNLSTTWCLSCFPQHQCQGGNPAILYENIAQHGIVSNHCVDYSWCATNPLCNGKATKHFKASHGKVNLSNLVPTCGCYENGEFYLYKIDKPLTVSMGKGGLSKDNFAYTVKKHIYKHGPVQGGFLVFKNFRGGEFTKVNGGVYLETGVYNKGEVHFDPNQVKGENYVGSHAVAVIGWGVEEGVVVDNKGTKKDVPYWYCRNSWTEKWGDGGYFKMAMYPYNKVSQFDKIVTMNTPKGKVGVSGMVMIKASQPPTKHPMKQLKQKMKEVKRIQPVSYYAKEGHDRPKGSFGGGKIVRYLLIVLAVIAGLVLLYFLVRKLRTVKWGGGKRRRRRNSGGGGRSGSYAFPRSQFDSA